MVSFSLRLGAFGFRGRGPRSLPGEPLCLQTLTVVRKCLLRDLVLSHCLLGVDLAKCLTRIALGFGDLFGRLKPVRRFCHFFAFSPISTSLRMASGRPGRSAILPLQSDSDQENQVTNNPEEGLGIMGPLPVLHFL